MSLLAVTGSTIFAVAGGLGLAVLGAVAYGLPLLVRWRNVRFLRRGFADRIALTFDDGPDGTTTPALLDLLQRRGVRATFFLVGFRADRVPEVCDRIVAEGHEVGCHAYWHKNYWRKWPWTGVRDLRHAYRAMARWLPATAPYRPPWGKLTGWQWLALVRRGSPVIWWTHVVGDTFDALPDVDAACEAVFARRGGVLLLHCHHADTDLREFVLRFTGRLIDMARERGVELVPLFATLEAGAAPAATAPTMSGARAC